MDAETKKSDSLYEFLAWLEVNKKRVAAGGAAALLVGGVIATVVWYNKRLEFQASEALSAIRLPYSPSEPVPPDTADKLQKMAQDYSGTAAAIRAELIRAGLLFTSGKYPEAQTAFEKFQRDHPESHWAPAAVYGVAVCLDAQNKAPEAIAKYEDFARRFGTDPGIDQARLSLGTLYEAANKPAEALKEYEKILAVKAMSYSPASGEAQERQRLLLIKYPNLAPTNTPAGQPTLPTTLPGASRPNPVTIVRTNLSAATSTSAVPIIRTNLAAVTNKPLVLKPTPEAPAAPKPASNAAPAAPVKSK